MSDKTTSPTEVAGPEDGSYELDMDENQTEDLAEVIEEAVAAVDGEKKGSTEKGDGKIVVEIVDGEEDDETSTSGSSGSARKTAELEEANFDLRERLARTMADYDNFRKRSEREKAAVRSFAISEVVSDFLGVIDNLERAATASGSVEDLKQGVDMILRLFGDTLRRHQVEKIEALGKPFDPSLHEAVAKQESADVDSPTVTAELQAGYIYKDRLLRPAMVNVAMPLSQPAQEDETDEQTS